MCRCWCRLSAGGKTVSAALLAKQQCTFHKAVVDATRGGFIQNAACASKRYGDLLLELNDVSAAADRYQDAIDSYKEWGAIRVAELLLEKHAALLGAIR